MATLDQSVSRRRFLAGAGASLAGAALTLANTECDPAIVRRIEQSRANAAPRHAVWVWQFSIDGAAEEIARNLAANNLAVVVKTHDGTEWMAKYDPMPGAISGPAQVATVAGIFENYGVPFHAWCVVKGTDPIREAGMAADVLAAGARSLTLDVESYDDFWVGTKDDAVTFGAELRRLDPRGRVDLSIDPRPWRIVHIPMREFVDVTDGIRPQLYWDVFNTPDTANAYAYMGFPPGPDGITPEFVLDTAHDLLVPYGRWLVPIAQSVAADSDAWPRFLHKAWELQMGEVDFWRYGVADARTLAYLGQNPPGPEPAMDFP